MVAHATRMGQNRDRYLGLRKQPSANSAEHQADDCAFDSVVKRTNWRTTISSIRACMVFGGADTPADSRAYNDAGARPQQDVA